MEQDKLFYNISRDTWNFVKDLKKPGKEMTDEEWKKAVTELENITNKYKSLGENERDLVEKILQSYLDYIELR